MAVMEVIEVIEVLANSEKNWEEATRKSVKHAAKSKAQDV